ncbi:MAG: hypothetical protein PVJ05_13915 [Candidatus Thorarchaeota archaeon]
MTGNDDYNEVEVSTEEINVMEAAVSSAVCLELIVGVLITPNLILIFGGLFPVFGFGPQPYPFILILINYFYMSVLIILVTASIYLAWALWRIIPRARFDAIVVNTISIIVHLLSLSPVIVLNLILIYFLNTRQMKDIYMKSIADEITLE